MKLNRIIAICLIMILTVLPTALAAPAAELTALEKTGLMEKLYFGTPQTGAFIDRVAMLEQEVSGAESSGAIVERVNRLYDYTLTTTVSSPSAWLQLQAVEWTFNQAVLPQKSMQARIESLERNVFGSNQTGALAARLERLMAAAFTGGDIEVEELTLPPDTLLKIRTLSKIDSAQSRVGDRVAFKIVDDVYVDGCLVIPAGALGQGKITKVQPRKNFGRDAKLEVAFDWVTSLDGSTISTVLGDKAQAETKSLAMAAGASVAGLVLLGPVGVVGGIFVQGKEIVVPIGTDLYIQTAGVETVYGLKTE